MSDLSKQEKLNKIYELVDKNEISAYKIAQETGLTEAGIGKILNKVSKNPHNTTVNILFDYLNNLVEKDFNSDASFKEISNRSPNTLKNGLTYHPLNDGTFDVEVKVLPFKAYASYLDSFSKGVIYDEMETAVFNVDHQGQGNYMAFIIKGDSMNGGKLNDTPDGAKVLGRELGRQHWRDGFYECDYGWIILSKQNIFHKDIVGFDKETGEITCHSRNESPEYCDFKLSLNDINQIFKVIKRLF